MNPRTMLRVVPCVLLLAVLPARAATPPTPDLHEDLWRPWTNLLAADSADLPNAVARLEGLTPTTRCGSTAPSLDAALGALGDVVGRVNRRAGGVRLPAATEAALAPLVACAAAHAAALTPYVPATPDEVAPDALRVAWLGAMGELTALANALPTIQVPRAITCVDVQCLVQLGDGANDTYTQPAIVSVDSGGADTYTNSAGGASPLNLLPVSVLVDQGAGNDRYLPALSDAIGFPTIGSGYQGGVGVLVDGGGSDTYRGLGGTMGSGISGGGVLLDRGTGIDSYVSPWAAGVSRGSSQKNSHGAAQQGGFGLLVDEGGADTYRDEGVASMGFGAAGGVGLLLDRGGNDTYTVVAAETAPLLGPCCTILVSAAIGHAEVGGVGVLLDQAGDDRYSCEPRMHYGCIGSSYLGELGLVYDEAGADYYHLAPMYYWSGSSNLLPGGLGSGGGAGAGVFVDVAGTDTYDTEEDYSYSTLTQFSGGYGNGGVGVFLDLGRTIDSYDFVGPAPSTGSRGNNGAWVDGTGGGVDR